MKTTKERQAQFDSIDAKLDTLIRDVGDAKARIIAVDHCFSVTPTIREMTVCVFGGGIVVVGLLTAIIFGLGRFIIPG